MPWARWAVWALLPVVTYSLLSLAGPLSAGRWWLVAALVVRLVLGVVVLVAVRGRRAVDPRWAVAYLLLVLVTAVLNRGYDVALLLVAGIPLVAVAVDATRGLLVRAGVLRRRSWGRSRDGVHGRGTRRGRPGGLG